MNLRPSSLVRAVENGVIGAAKLVGTGATLAAGGVVLGAKRAEARASRFAHGVSIEFRARKLASQLAEVGEFNRKVATLDDAQREALLLDQVEVAQRAAQLLRKRR